MNRRLLDSSADLIACPVDLKACLNSHGLYNSFLLSYAHTLLAQSSQSAVCNSFHTAEQRLARWLLMARDRVNEDILRFTQEMLSHMLGVPRNSVRAARALQNQGLIQYRRGEIRILERQKLEGAACECYHIVKEELSHFLAAEHPTR